MAGYYYFAHLIRTNIITGVPHKLIRDPVTIELFQGPRHLRVNELVERILPPDSKAPRYHERDLELEAGPSYLMLTARTKYSDSAGGTWAQNAIDRALTAIVCLERPDLAATPLFRGWLVVDRNTMHDAWLKYGPVTPFALGDTERDAHSALTALAADPDVSGRYSLMSRLFVRQAGWPPSEEKFLLLWMILEVFPMRDTSDIKPLVSFLATRTGHSEEHTMVKLELGRLFGVRSKLVHDGAFPEDHKVVGPLLNKLELICIEAIRAVLGYPYTGILARYFS